MIDCAFNAIDAIDAGHARNAGLEGFAATS
jgi:hypothetical protein